MVKFIKTTNRHFVNVEYICGGDTFYTYEPIYPDLRIYKGNIPEKVEPIGWEMKEHSSSFTTRHGFGAPAPLGFDMDKYKYIELEDCEVILPELDEDAEWDGYGEPPNNDRHIMLSDIETISVDYGFVNGDDYEMDVRLTNREAVHTMDYLTINGKMYAYCRFKDMFKSAKSGG